MCIRDRVNPALATLRLLVEIPVSDRNEGIRSQIRLKAASCYYDAAMGARGIEAPESFKNEFESPRAKRAIMQIIDVRNRLADATTDVEHKK